jgi:hypothetical protein
MKYIAVSKESGRGEVTRGMQFNLEPGKLVDRL